MEVGSIGTTKIIDGLKGSFIVPQKVESIDAERF